MKIMVCLFVALGLWGVEAGTLKISVDTNWAQLFVVGGNSNEVVAKVILDGTDLDQDVKVNDIPLTLSVSNASFAALTNCFLWGSSYSLPIGEDSIILFDVVCNPISVPQGTNRFTFSSAPRVFRGEKTELFLICGIARNQTNGYFRWGLGNEYRSTGNCRFENFQLVCDNYTNQLYSFPDGNLIDVEMIQTDSSWTQIRSYGSGAKLTITEGRLDSAGMVRRGHIFGQGRPLRKYTVMQSGDLRTWLPYEPLVETGLNGNFFVGYSNYVTNDSARFFRAEELGD